MARKLDDMMAALPPDRLQRIDARAMELATLKDLRQAAQQTQEQLAATLGVGQDTIAVRVAQWLRTVSKPSQSASRKLACLKQRRKLNDFCSIRCWFF